MFILGEITCTFFSPPLFMDEVFSEERVKKDNEMGGSIPGGNFQGGDFPGGSLMGTNFPGGNCSGGNFPRTGILRFLQFKDHKNILLFALCFDM